MRKTARRRLFYLLILAFIFTIPLLLVYSLGYTLNITKKAVMQTGGIFIKSQIPRLSIFLNAQFVKESSIFSGGALLTGVEPGTYLLRLEKEGYTAWSKAVTVDPAVVTEIRNVLLASKKPPIATSTAEEVLKLQEEIKVLDSQFSINRKGALVERTSTTTVVVAQDVHSFGAWDNTILFVNRSGFLSKIALATKTIEIIGRPGFFIEEGKPFTFIRSPAGDFAILDSSGGLFILSGMELRTITGGVLKAAFDNHGGKLMLVKDRDIGILWMKNHNYQPFQKAGMVEHIITVPSSIKDTAWFYKDSAHIVLNTKEGIFMTETDGRGGRNTVELYPERADEIRTFVGMPDAIFFKKGKTWLTTKL